MNKVTTKDLNMIDAMNSNGNVQAREGQPADTPVGDGRKSLKGALAAYGGSFKPYDEYLFIEGLRTQIYEFLSEQYDYGDTLPKGLTKYRVERKLIENGITFIVKEGDTYFSCVGSVTDWNMYKEPVGFIVNEPYSALNGRKFGQNDEWVFIRNNVKQNSKLKTLFRYFSDLEKVFFQIEKNLLASAPKGLIDTRLGSIEWGEELQNGFKNAMEVVINSQDTFFELKVPENVMSAGRGAGLTTGDNKNVFIPIELTDRTDNLIKNFTFIKEQIKEIIGADLNSVLGKKERMINGEIDNQQSLSDKTETHGLNIRINDWNFFNETFGENVVIVSPDQEAEKEVTKEEENE